MKVDEKNKKPLYRKANKTAFNHGFTKNHFKDEKNSKKIKEFGGYKLGMRSKQNKGMDYTPLFRFLLSKVGKNWDEVFSEAISRLDKEEPIFWIVERPNTPLAKHENDNNDKFFGIVRVGESTYYHQLYIDENNILQKVNPSATIEALCKCCTHTLNGNIIHYKEED